jgi:hypothetical protein
MYWTSGSRVDCASKEFTWCSTKNTFLSGKIAWAKNNPTASKGDCAALDVRPNGAAASFYSNADCSTKKKFVCEVRYLITNIEA